MSLKGTMTEQNLLKAFAGESQARNRYVYAAKVARKEGYHQIAAIFEETAENEVQHAKHFFRFLEGGMVEITATYPAGVIGTTAENLKAAAEGEYEEWADLYPGFAKVADEEGFRDVAVKFRMIARAEKAHEERFKALLERVEGDTVWVRPEPVRWKCGVCGYIHEGKSPPDECPSCQHPKGYFAQVLKNY